jgi:hypothetical protein
MPLASLFFPGLSGWDQPRLVQEVL